MLPDTKDVIAAISTSYEKAGRSVLRASGETVFEVIQSIFTADKSVQISDIKGFKRISGVVHTPSLSLPAVAYIFRAPRSYTRQNLVELHLPCSAAILDTFLLKLFENGARQSQPGEFTLRALTSGRIDLARAEAIADIISADNEAELRRAQANAAGKLSRLCASWSRRVTELLAEIEASIDMAEEHLETITAAAAASEMLQIARDMEGALAQSAAPTAGDALKRMVLIGQPNAGKSSLANALLASERTIVSQIAGATRDAISATVTLADGTDIMLCDTAGVQLDGDKPTDAPVSSGNSHHETSQHSDFGQRSISAARSADIVAIVCDAAESNLQDITLQIASYRQLCGCTSPGGPAVMLILAKSDLIEAEYVESLAAKISQTQQLAALGVSARTGEGLDRLNGEIINQLEKSTSSAATGVLMHQRHINELTQAVELLGECATSMTAVEYVSDIAELSSCDLREVLLHIGMIDGHCVGEQLLSVIFSRFCIGK